MKQKVFRDPIHGNITISLPNEKVILELIDTVEFQRLRRITQLGTSYLIYHGAEHSRFTHSLGVYHLMGEALGFLINANEKNEKILIKHSLEAKIAALLHDVGHGPFSHTFEILNLKSAKNHEKWTIDLIKGNTEINQILRKHKISIANVVSIIDGSFEVPLFCQLLSSQIDVDRMDYLLRDSYFTGVKYGIFDWQRLIRALEVYEKQKKLYLAFNVKAKYALEEFILARYFMYEQVYLHKKVLASEFMVKSIFMRVKDLVDKGNLVIRNKSLKALFEKSNLSISEFLSLDDHLLRAFFVAMKREDDQILKNLCSRFLTRDIFKVIEVESGLRKKMNELKTDCVKRGRETKYYLGKIDGALIPYQKIVKLKKHKLIYLKGNRVLKDMEVGKITKYLEQFKRDGVRIVVG